MSATRDTAGRVGLILGPAAALALLLFADLDPERPAATATAAVAVWMAVWWMTEAAPLAVTALLPVVLYPLLGVMSGKATAPYYMNSIIFLFLGGFLVALAMERWQLHRRIALAIMLTLGGGPRRIVLGFMLAAGFLSMWISNTATAMMMAPIVVAVARRVSREGRERDAALFGAALLLGTAYGASIGGLATLIGTPPNPLFVSNLALLYPDAPEIGFASWMILGLPLSVVFMFVAWGVIGRMFRLDRLGDLVDHGVFREESAALGPMTYEEKIVMADFVLLALLWLTRKGLDVGSLSLPGWSDLLSHGSLVDDGTVAIAFAVLLFLVPSRRPGTRILDWSASRDLPWGIVLLFGGGFALAAGFTQSGLTIWLGERMQGLAALPPVLLVMGVCLTITFLTELTSNTATTQMALPVLAGVAGATGINPLLLMVPATLSASCAFMLPVATPPNAIIFGTGRVTIRQMSRTGLVLNLIGVVLITAAVWTLGGAAFGTDLSVSPTWAGGGH